MKRFYKMVTVEPNDGDFAVALDGREIKTPAKNTLLLPTDRLAEMVAEEWRRQEGDIIPGDMPVTQLANTVHDRVRAHRPTITEELLKYGETDLVCYRADGPEELVDRQNAEWSVFIDHLEKLLDVRLVLTCGVMPAPQPDALFTRLENRFEQLSDFQFAAVHQLITGLGSIVLALGLMDGIAKFNTTFEASQLDALFQEEHWGADSEVLEKRIRLKEDLLIAYEFYQAAS